MATQPNSPLPNGFQLLEYRIEKKLSSGGFSIVYLARDQEDNPVAIKEYLPSSLVLRTNGHQVQLAAEQHQATFRHGLKCFFEEGRALAKIDHPNIVRVENFFRANDTVYMVMQYVRGRTLQYHIQAHRYEFTDIFMRRIFSQLLNGLREVHTHKLVHLDIKPANIYVNMDGTPVLLDFGAARLGISDDKARLKPMYTPGFAAPEQYRTLARLGPWTDIYSVGATMFSCLAGFPPQAADARMKDDKVTSAKKLWGERYSAELLDIIDWCMRLDPLERPQSVFALQKALVQPRPTPASGTSLPSMLSTLKHRLNKT